MDAATRLSAIASLSSSDSFCTRAGEALSTCNTEGAKAWVMQERTRWARGLTGRVIFSAGEAGCTLATRPAPWRAHLREPRLDLLAGEPVQVRLHRPRGAAVPILRAEL